MELLTKRAHGIPVRLFTYTLETFALSKAVGERGPLYFFNSLLGAAQPEMSQAPDDQPHSGYKKGIGYALWAACFAGAAGLHRIYLGKYGTGIIWMLTWGLFGIGQIYDLFSMKKLIREANIRDGYLPHPRWAGELARMAQTPAKLPAASAKPLKHQLLDAAMERGGELSVTEGVAATGADFDEVENTLNELLETGYIDIDNRPGSGVIVYRFTELR